MSALRLVSVSLLALISFPCFAQQQTLSNDDVVKLEKSGIGDDLVVATLNAQPGSYKLSTDDILALKKQGVSDKVIATMIARANAPATTAANAGSVTPGVAGVDEVGVYYKDHAGKWVEMEPEIVNYKSGGVLKTLATDGIVKQDRNGHIQGPSAKLAVARPVDFLFYVPEGTSPEEYQLLKLRPSNGKSREFRSMTGGVFHASTGASRDDIQFTSTKVASRMYAVTLPSNAIAGEYGILPPGAITSSNAASAGKMYTFKVME